MERLFRLLYKIKENPALYFGGRETLALLRAFIGGYIERQWEIEKSPEFTYALNGFQEFVQKKYKLGNFTVHSWDRIIDFYSSSDKEAWDRFYKLLDEFLNENK